jgi:putative ABC transport system permease protein
MGMTLFEANSRVKEIGIRKVLGAEVLNIVTLLTKDIFVMVLFAFIVSVPLVYLLASGWLMEYPEHISFSLWFVAAPFLLVTVLIGLVSVSQVLKVATRNPVESLKHE